MTTRRPSRPRRKRKASPAWWKGRRLTEFGRQSISVLVLAATLFLRERTPAVPVVKREEEAPPAVWSVDVRGPDSWWGVSAAARRLPPRPFPEQKHPPCMPPDEEAINGGCWLALRSVAPCASTAFEHAGRCYHPVKQAQRPPTSLVE